ncbi:hypothetical protein HY251_13455 [bacterium]|nr:hypothetical protein [bacterium]
MSETELRGGHVASDSAPRPPATARGVHLRPATRDDNKALCELMKSITMESDLELAVERDPDFFALYDLQEAKQLSFVVERAGEVLGSGTYLGRDGYLAGARVPVGYAGDLRFAPGARGGFVLGRHFGATFREACRAFGCEAMLTVVISSNELARRALVERHPRFPDKPFYRPWVGFDILSVHFTSRGRPRATDLIVRRAREDDLGAIGALLERDHRSRPFGYAIDEGVIRERLRRWPGLAVESFYVAHDRAGRMRGTVAVWEAAPVKRFRVLSYRGRMRWVKAGLGLVAPLTGATSLPRPGELFRYLYLTHVSIADEDPAAMAALLDRIYDDHHGRGYHFLSACVLEGDPLAPAFARYRKTALPARLYVVSEPGNRWNESPIGPGRPGFEMALV